MNDEKHTEDQKVRFLDKVNPKLLFSYANILKNLPFMIFLFLLAIFYIWNGHKGEKYQKELLQIQEEVVEYEWEFNTTTSTLNNKSMQSEISRMVESLGLRELTSPPEKIELSDDEH